MYRHKIPTDFYSFETNQPFEHCIECGKYLLDNETEYLIEKAVKNYKHHKAKDVVFDYAICMDCAEKTRKKVSKNSWQAIMNYFQKNLNVKKRMEMMEREPATNLKSCMIKGTASGSCEEYQIYAHCKGEKLNMENPPYLISGDVMDEIIPLLSKKTIDEMNGFFSKHFSPDPALFELAPKSILV